MVIYTLVVNHLFCCSPKPIINPVNVDSLEHVIDSLKSKRDTLFIIKDSIKKEIIQIEKEYETKYINVDSQSIDSDIKFFSEYLSKNF